MSGHLKIVMYTTLVLLSSRRWHFTSLIWTTQGAPLLEAELIADVYGAICNYFVKFLCVTL